MAGAGDSVRSDADSPQVRREGGMPRWVKVFVLVGLLVLVLVAIMLLAGHGPSQHLDQALVLVPSLAAAA